MHRTCIILLTLLLILQGGALTQATEPCVDLSGIVDPTTVVAGGIVALHATVTNCSIADTSVVVDYTAQGPCGYSDAGSIELNIESRETQNLALPYTVPHCPGDYMITATATADGTVVATNTSLITVQ